MEKPTVVVFIVKLDSFSMDEYNTLYGECGTF